MLKSPENNRFSIPVNHAADGKAVFRGMIAYKSKI